jgi:WD40 repeat protein
MTNLRWLLLVAAMFLLPQMSRGNDAGVEKKMSFKRDVAPILLQQCQTCHGPDKAKAKFRVDSFERLKMAGSSGDPSITAGKPDKSQLYLLLVSKDPDERMPKKADPLPKAQTETVRKWIEQGAAFDGPDPSAALASYVDAARHDTAPAVYKRPIPITALAFTPGGEQLIASGYHELTRWDAKTGKLIARTPLPIERVQSVALDPEGKRVAVAGGTPGVGGELLLLSNEDRSAPVSLEKTADMMLVARFSPDGKFLAAGGSDGGVRLHDVSSGKRLWKLEPHADWVTDIAFSPDGKLLATASRDKSCRVIEVKTGLVDASYLEQAEPVFAIAFADEGKTIYSAGRDKKIHGWTASDAKPLSQTGGFGSDVLRLAAVGNTIISAGGDGKVRLHASDKAAVPASAPATKPSTKPADTKKKTEKPTPRLLLQEIDAGKEWIYALAVDERTGRIAAGSQDGHVRVWTLEDAKLIKDFIAAPK